MSQVTIFNNDPANVTITVVSGDPPVDQTALVASLQADLATANANLATATAALTAAQAEIAAEKPDLVALQAALTKAVADLP